MRNPVILALLVLVLGACSTLSEKQRSADLNSALFHYNEAIRWGDFAAAGKFRRPQDGPAGPLRAGTDPVRVTASGIGQVDLAEDKRSADVTMAISYYRDSGLQVKTVTDRQHWVYDADRKAWFITTPVPVLP
jgi:hypothetical protein